MVQSLVVVMGFIHGLGFGHSFRVDPGIVDFMLTISCLLILSRVL